MAVSHKIFARHAGVERDKRLPIPLIKHCIKVALQEEGACLPCEVSVLITNDAAIRALNLEYRGIDRATDVLSFPMRELTPGAFLRGEVQPEPGSQHVQLGDIILSADTVWAQAKQFRQSVGREAGYLTLHSVLHLLGYDHVDEGPEKKKMRAREKEIQKKAGFGNEDKL